MDRNVLLDVLEQAFRPIVDLLSTLTGTDRGTAFKGPQVEEGRERNYRDVASKIYEGVINNWGHGDEAKEGIIEVLTEWDSTVTTIPDAHDHMQEMRRYLQHYDNKEMSAASLIDVFVKEINRYFE